MDINKKNIYIKMDAESTVFYTILDNVQKIFKEIPANSIKVIFERAYFENVCDYLQHFITDNITDNIIKIVFNNIRC